MKPENVGVAFSLNSETVPPLQRTRNWNAVLLRNRAREQRNLEKD